MTYVIAEPCIGTKDTACVDVCPVDCIHPGENQLFINPDECIDCAVCIPECPVNAIYAEEDVPADQVQFIKINVDLARSQSGPDPAPGLAHALSGVCLGRRPQVGPIR